MMPFRLSLLPILLLVPACTGWPSGWQQAKHLPATDRLSGAWIGTWRSLPSGHSGKLRCAVFPKSPTTWEYRYRATWAKILCAGFTVTCSATPQADSSIRLAGSRDLGPVFGGTFTHTGTVSGDLLQATYQSSADRGTLTLQRLAPLPWTDSFCHLPADPPTP
jgi:hypothetical protein